MSKFYEEIKSFYGVYDLNHSWLSKKLKHDLYACMLNEDKIIAKIQEFDNMPKITHPSFDVIFSRRNILIKNKNHESDVLKYCRSRWYEPTIIRSTHFEYDPLDEHPIVRYNPHVKNYSVFIASLAHEIGHCLWAQKIEDTEESQIFQKEPKSFRESDLFDEIAAWHLGLHMLRFFMERWFPVIEWFTNFDHFCDFMHLCTLSYHANKTPTSPLYLIREEKAYQLLYGPKNI